MIFWCVLTQIFFNPLSMILLNQFVVIWISNRKKGLKVSIDSNVQQQKVLFGCSWSIFAEPYSEFWLSNISGMEFLLKIVIFLMPLTMFAKGSISDVWVTQKNVETWMCYWYMWQWHAIPIDRYAEITKRWSCMS